MPSDSEMPPPPPPCAPGTVLPPPPPPPPPPPLRRAPHTSGTSCPMCAICEYRAKVLPERDEEEQQTCRIGEELNPLAKEIEIARHKQPGEFWRKVLNALHLESCSIVEDELGRMWCKFPLRGMHKLMDPGLHQTQATWVENSEGVVRLCEGKCTMWHTTKLAYLVQQSDTCTGSKGILNDGFLRYGSCTHNGRSGVFSYSYAPYRWFTAHDQWCCLKLDCIPYFSHLKGGARGRYCIRGPEGEPCTVVQPVELLIMHCDVPEFVKL